MLKLSIQMMVFKYNLHFNVSEKVLKKAFSPCKKTLSGISFHIDNRKTTLIFKNGAIIITGVKNKKEAQEVIDKIKAHLDKAKISYKENLGELKLVNMVATGQVPFKIDLYKGSNASLYFYGAIFPGRVYNIENFCVKVYHNGKIVVVGLKSLKDLKKIKDKLYNLLKSLKIS